MSILKAMFAGASGLSAHSKAIGVVSDNISNLNTVSYKATRARFEDVLGNTVAGSIDNQGIGHGVRVGGVHANFAQGSLVASRLNTDMALQGDGFFVVRGTFDGGQDKQFYTRDGQFHISAEGKLVNSKGLSVQGYTADQNENLSNTLGDLDIPLTAVVPPNPTTEVGMETNLSPNADFIADFDVADPQSTSHFSTSVTIYDTLGVSHNVNVFFNQTATGQWSWNAVANGAEMSDPATPGGVLSGNVGVASGTLEFNQSGALVNETQDVAQNNFQFFNAADQVINFNFGTSINEGGTGLDGTRQFDSPSTVSNISQDGYGAGALAGIKVNMDGTINGTFTNGERRVLASVAVARFVNNDGLIRRDAGHWVESPDSGQALVGNAGAGGRGSIVGNNLEQSTVEIANEFVKIIAYQRGFQANSRAIRTADQMLMEAVSIKR